MNLFGSQLKGDDKDSFFNGIVGGIVSYAQYYEKKDWRKMASLFTAMGSFPNYFPPTVLYDRFIPILFAYVKSGATSLRPRCCELLVMFTVKLAPPAVVDVYTRVTNELRRSVTCYHRAAYLKIFVFTVEKFSRKFVRERCVESVSELVKDSTAVVRTELAKALLAWRQTLRGSNDQQLVENYTTVSQKLLMDEDELVRGAARQSMDCVRTMEADWSRGTRTGDAEDTLKEAQEGNLTDLVKDLKTNERRHKLKELLRDNEIDGPVRRIPSNQSKPSMLRVPTGGHAAPQSKYTPVSTSKSPQTSSTSVTSKYGPTTTTTTPSSRSKSGVTASSTVAGRPKR
eukprot:GILI01013522.1.p1 GENE.GILI01013522.1~~GILI01013522.1.p1  ORF type:complete len:364 (+),score=43.64 GILI01013522.1:68-1093(+)